MCVMARDARYNLSAEEKTTRLAKSTTVDNFRLADQLVEKLGTSRKSEIQGKITNTGEPYEKNLNDYLLGL